VGIQCVGGQEETPGLVAACLSGRERRSPGSGDLLDHVVGWHAWPGASPFPRAGQRAPCAGGQARGVPVLRQRRQCLPRVRVAGQGGAAQLLPGLAVCVPRLAALFVDGALCWSLAGLGVEAAPALCHPAGGRPPRLRAIARLERRHGLRIAGRQAGLGRAHRCRPPGEPRPRRLRELRAVGRALEGTIGDQGGGTRRGVPRLEVGTAHLAALLRLTAITTARRPQHGETGVGLDHQLQPPLVQVGPMIPAIALGEVQNPRLGLLVAVRAPVDMDTGAIEMGKARREASALSGCGRTEAVECCHPGVGEGLQGPTAGVIVERFRSHTRRNAARGGCILTEPGDEGEGVMDKPHTIAPHRFDGLTDREVPPCRVVVGGVSEDVAHGECVAHASDKAEVVEDLATVHGLVGPDLLLW
jgi:hypothetical protein